MCPDHLLYLIPPTQSISIKKYYNMDKSNIHNVEQMKPEVTVGYVLFHLYKVQTGKTNLCCQKPEQGFSLGGLMTGGEAQKGLVDLGEVLYLGLGAGYMAVLGKFIEPNTCDW